MKKRLELAGGEWLLEKILVVAIRPQKKSGCLLTKTLACKTSVVWYMYPVEFLHNEAG